MRWITARWRRARARGRGSCAKGGRGNFELISKRNPNPQICEQGEKRKSIDVKLIFSIYSDISIVGLPNAGKSTLIQKLTNSKARIGDYEFTTTSPNIGVLNNLNPSSIEPRG